MGALPQPNVPDGPVRTLFTALHELHHQAGWPSLRDMAKEIGCSHTTISAAFSRPVVPRWGLLELIVEGLGGDTEQFHQLWLDASQAGPSAATPAPVVVADVPRQLPADVSAFTGRAAELAQLDRLMAVGGGAVISGTAGVGKTALAVHWAHTAARRFTDGQLYLNLRGYDPGSPVSATTALESMLRSLGVDGAAIPQDQAERAARYRTVLADKKLLVVLDNANSIDQIRDLLPGGAPCFVLVTSRDSMRGLVARHGSVRVNLDLLAEDEAIALLRTLIGRRVDDEPDAARQLAARCARLPLALRVAAELATGRAALSLSDLNRELDDESAPLDALTTGDDDYSAVRTVFSWSRGHLSEPAGELFALLGLHPGREIDRAAVAAIADVAPSAAGRLLAELARAHLIEEQRSGSFGMHDLLRGYTVELADDLPAATRAAARSRLRGYYLGMVASANTLAYPHRPHDPSEPRFTDASAAREWLRTQWRNVVAVAEADPDAAAVEASRLLADYLEEGAHYDAALAVHELARATAVRQHDRAGEGTALNCLGVIQRNQGHFDLALADHTAALAAFREATDRSGEGRALHGIGSVNWRHGNYRAAYEAFHESVAIQREVGDRSDEGNALYALGIASRRLGRYTEAETHHRAAIQLLRAANDLAGEGRALNNLGVVHMYLGRNDEALAEFERSFEIHLQLGSRVGEAVVHDNLGSTRRRLGELDEALAEYREALTIYLDIGYRVGEGDAIRGIGATLGRLGRYGEAVRELRRAVELGRELGEVEVTTGALTDLGEVQLAAGDAGAATKSFQAALELADQTGDPYYSARALAGAAAALHAAGDAAGARERWQQALDRYADMGLPEADEVRARLG
jgi:tetratricopeptide (TPR) repeat protein